jgi:crossover junction endodeoxyribonuclease RuvC
MRVLGVDPGLTRCGIGVVQGSAGRALALVHVEVVRTPAADPLAARLLSLADALSAAVAEHRPDVVVVERVFAQQNVRTVTGTAQAAGLAMVAAARHGIPVHLHTPSEVKAAITGSGVADKAQVTAMVTRILKLDVAPTPADAADALALAICHLWRGAAQARLDAALTQAKAAARAPARGGRAPLGAAPAGPAATGPAATGPARIGVRR